MALFDETLALARQTEHPITLCFVLGLRGPTLVNAGLAPEVGRDCRELIAVADEQGAPLWLGVGRLFQAWALVAQGERERAADSQPALALAGSTGSLAGAPALAASAQLGQVFYDAELLRLKGECLLRLEDRPEEHGEAQLRTAIDIARTQEARSLELRAATSLARLRQRQGKRAEARDLLGPVHDWFTEGFDTQDVKDARQLLEELA